MSCPGCGSSERGDHSCSACLQKVGAEFDAKYRRKRHGDGMHEPGCPFVLVGMLGAVALAILGLMELVNHFV
jgi:hypothetical protein